jgi:hypothetical protein
MLRPLRADHEVEPHVALLDRERPPSSGLRAFLRLWRMRLELGIEELATIPIDGAEPVLV